jgi:hybrid cluster-associated redox disulfide protein
MSKIHDPDHEADQTVAVFLRARPEAAQAFIRRRMACVGCVVAAFESLREVARNYGIEEEQFLAEIGIESPGREY